MITDLMSPHNFFIYIDFSMIDKHFAQRCQINNTDYNFLLISPAYTTNKPIIFAVSAVAFILLPFFVFLVYDRIIQKQQNEIIVTANQSHAIVSSLFPSSVRDQLFPSQAAVPGSGGISKSTSLILGPPIAELYPETTVLFCDVANFTKWSSGKIVLNFYYSFSICA